jgi:hypothetical protein
MRCDIDNFILFKFDTMLSEMPLAIQRHIASVTKMRLTEYRMVIVYDPT